MINDDSDDHSDEPDNRETTNYEDLSEIELLEMEDMLVKELRVEGLLRPVLVKTGGFAAETEAADNFQIDWDSAF